MRLYYGREAPLEILSIMLVHSDSTDDEGMTTAMSSRLVSEEQVHCFASIK
jgi:hypothetical protein